MSLLVNIFRPRVAASVKVLSQHGKNTATCRHCSVLRKISALPGQSPFRPSRPYTTHRAPTEHSDNTEFSDSLDEISERKSYSASGQGVNEQVTVENSSPKQVKSVPMDRVLHRREIIETEVTDAEWSEFSKNLPKEDLFGTLKSSDAKDVRGHTRAAHRKKKHRRKSLSEFQQRKHDPEWTSQFGSLADDDPDFKEMELDTKRYTDDEGEEDSFEQPYRRLAVEGRKHTPNWYGRQIEKLSREGKIYECVQVLETKMLKEDRVMPNEYVFTVLIGALGRVGYTKKAFSLYHKMKKFGLRPEDPTYTALFNACSNSPWREDGLQRANRLLEQMQERDIKPNLTTYKAMVKTFGRCGDLRRAFSLVDDLNAADLRADEEVFAMLLQSCISEKEAGLRYAIEVCRRLKKRKKAAPTLFHYNLLLRAIRDCEIGDPVLAQQLVSTNPQDYSVLPLPGDQEKQLGMNKEPDHEHVEFDSELYVDKRTEVDDAEESEAIELLPPAMYEESPINELGPELPAKSWWAYEPDDMTSLVKHLEVEQQNQSVSAVSILDADVPDILGHSGDFGAIVGLGSLDTRENRLALFGGLPGILKQMRMYDIRPDIRTFTLLLDLIPSTREAEQDLLASMKAYQIKIDVDFLNLVIRKRNLRKDYDGAKDIFQCIGQLNLQPNIVTYGCLAMGCAHMRDGLQLLRDMEVSDAVPNVSIFKILFYQSRMNFKYKLSLCQNMKRLRIAPDEVLLTRLEHSIEKARKIIVLKEKGYHVSHSVHHQRFNDEFEIFMKEYKPWLLSMQLDQSVHPWEHFRKPTPVDNPDGTT